MPCTLIYQLLLIDVNEEDRESIDMRLAKKNYLSILKRVHTDKQQSETNKRATQAVVRAWGILSDEDKAYDYANYGRMGLIDECIDWDSLPELIDFIKKQMESHHANNSSRTSTSWLDNNTTTENDKENLPANEQQQDRGTESSMDHEQEPPQTSHSRENDEQRPDTTEQPNNSQDGKRKPRKQARTSDPLARTPTTIIDHSKRFRKNKEPELKFRIQWAQGYSSLESIEDTLLYPEILKEYLKHLEKNKKKVFGLMMRRWPELNKAFHY